METNHDGTHGALDFDRHKLTSLSAYVLFACTILAFTVTLWAPYLN
jgi:hypothetical protein